MGKKHDRIAAKAAKTVKERHKEPVAEAMPDASMPQPVAAPKPKREAKAKEPLEGGLVPMPKMPSATRARKPKPMHDCACGCGGQTRSLWVPGHDARAKGWAMRIERNIVTMADVPENERPGAKKMLEARKGIAKADIKLVDKAVPAPVAVNE